MEGVGQAEEAGQAGEAEAGHLPDVIQQNTNLLQVSHQLLATLNRSRQLFFPRIRQRVIIPHRHKRLLKLLQFLFTQTGVDREVGLRDDLFEEILNIRTPDTIGLDTRGPIHLVVIEESALILHGAMDILGVTALTLLLGDILVLIHPAEINTLQAVLVDTGSVPTLQVAFTDAEIIHTLQVALTDVGNAPILQVALGDTGNGLTLQVAPVDTESDFTPRVALVDHTKTLILLAALVDPMEAHIPREIHAMVAGHTLELIVSAHLEEHVMIVRALQVERLEKDPIPQVVIHVVNAPDLLDTRNVLDLIPRQVTGMAQALIIQDLEEQAIRGQVVSGIPDLMNFRNKVVTDLLVFMKEVTAGYQPTQVAMEECQPTADRAVHQLGMEEVIRRMHILLGLLSAQFDVPHHLNLNSIRIPPRHCMFPNRVGPIPLCRPKRDILNIRLPTLDAIPLMMSLLAQS